MAGDLVGYYHVETIVLSAVPVQFRKHDVVNHLLREALEACGLVGVAFGGPGCRVVRVRFLYT